MLVPAVILFALLNMSSFTHGHFLVHASYTEVSGFGVDHHVYGLNAFGLIVFVALISLYWGLMMGTQGPDNGQTIGMRRAGIRVVADDGHELSGARACVRFVIMALLWIAFVVPGLLDCLWPLWDRERRALHDLICRTHVVQVDSPRRTWTP